MRMLEVFSGTGRMSQAFRERGWDAKTIDNTYSSDLQIDARSLTKRKVIELCGGEPDFLWMSPPCTAFSVASIGTHWGGGHRAYIPKTQTAKIGLELLAKCHEIRSWFPGALWMIENPMGVMRKMPSMQDHIRHTITFCQYGEKRMKPTDIWTNVEGWVPRPRCKNGAPCHDRAPRGAKTGTQGLKGAYERGALPYELCTEISQTVTDIFRRGGTQCQSKI